MSLRINTNVDAQAAHRYLTKTSDQVSKSMERLSSGLRINSAADDATTTSQAAASPMPPAKAGPWTRAMTGFCDV